MSEFIELPLSETDDLELKHKSLFFVPQYTFKKNKRCLVIIIPKKALVLLTVLKGINST